MDVTLNAFGFYFSISAGRAVPEEEPAPSVVDVNTEHERADEDHSGPQLRFGFRRQVMGDT